MYGLLEVFFSFCFSSSSILGAIMNVYIRKYSQSRIPAFIKHYISLQNWFCCEFLENMFKVLHCVNMFLVIA